MVVCSRIDNSLVPSGTGPVPVKRLSGRFLDDMVGRRLPPHLQQKYMDAAASFAEYYKNSPPGRLNAEDVTAYLMHLAIDQKVPLDEQKTVLCGLRFLYGVTLGREWAQQLNLVVPQPAVGGRVTEVSFLPAFGSGKRVRDRMVEDMTLRGLSPRTHKKYLEAVADFVRFHGGRPPGQLGPEEVKAYQLHLIRERKLARKSITVYVCALRFLYRVTLNKPWAIERIVYGKRRRYLPDIPSPEDVSQLIESTVELRHRVMLSAAYGAGLRRAEVAALRVNDMETKQRILRVVDGKGGKDRLVMLSPKLQSLIEEYTKAARPRHWLFPGQKPGTHVCGETVGDACRKAWQRSGLEKPIHVRLLRGAFATHLLEMGTEAVVIQRLMGHEHLKTTLLYARVAARTISATQSPLDLLPTPSSEV